MSLTLLVAVLKLLIISTVQNLIRFGDFQNLAPPLDLLEVHAVNCSTYCDGIWYITSPDDKIELQMYCPVQGNQTTTAVDLIFYNYIQLCQDFNTSEIQKTYQYTFDMRCNIHSLVYNLPNVESCSVWVILNGQVINGSNHTNTDKRFQHKVGYMKITQQSNTICFQSRQVPFLPSFGTDLDNTTLQIYTGKTPCNVIGCKFCVLNFPDICQICQYMFILEGSSCQCQSKLYLNGGMCKMCLFPCEICQGQARKCLYCSTLYRLQGNQCTIGDERILVASAIVSIPGIEFSFIGQILLGILDQFWPYYSHNRAYGNQTIDILTFIHTLQNNKWFLLSLDKKIDFNFQSLNFSDYSAYSNQQFLKMESKTSYFWDGAFEIVFFSFPIMLLVFFVLNKIFYLTFECRISKHFRPYSFFLLIYFLGIGEDVSYLSFLSFSNAINLFSFKFQDKLGHIVWVLVFFLLVFFCSAGYFVAKFLYNKLSKYFIDGFFPKLQSFHILSCLSMKAFVIGSVNALLATNYEALIICLTSTEMVYLIIVIYLQWKNRCYQIQTFMFLQMLKSIVMTVFNVSLWIDWKIRALQQGQAEQQTKKLLEFNCKALIIAIIGLGALQAISMYFSGREMLNHKRQKQVPKSEKLKRQVLKIVKLKQNVQVPKEITEKQRMRAQKNYFYQANAVEQVGKQLFMKIRIQKNKSIKIKKYLKRHSNALNIIRQQDEHDQQPQEIIFRWNNT